MIRSLHVDLGVAVAKSLTVSAMAMESLPAVVAGISIEYNVAQTLLYLHIFTLIRLELNRSQAFFITQYNTIHLTTETLHILQQICLPYVRLMFQSFGKQYTKLYTTY